MKIKKGFILRPFMNKYIALAVDETSPQNALITMSGSGAFVWQCLEEDISYDALLTKITDKYDVDPAAAAKDLDSFLATARNAGILEE